MQDGQWLGDVDVRLAAGTGRDVPAYAPLDLAWYCRTYLDEQPGVALAAAQAHYDAHVAERALSPNALFDEAWFRARYPETARRVRRGEVPSAHAAYCAGGFASHDPHWLFERERYARALADQGVTTDDPYDHFLRVGQGRGDSGHALYEPSGRHCVDQPYSGFLRSLGAADAAPSPLFDAGWYRAMHEDGDAGAALRQAGSAIAHYLTNTAPTRCNPLPEFDEAYYLAHNADAADAVAAGRHRNGYAHFLDVGRYDDRRPSVWFDPAHYRTLPLVRQALNDGSARTAFDHYVRRGRALGLPPLPPLCRNAAREADGKAVFARAARTIARAAAAAPVVLPTQREQPGLALSVLVVCFNQFDYTLQTLASLAPQLGGGAEVILVDNASVDETRHIEDYVHGLTVIRLGRNAGFLRAVNLAGQAARGRHLLLLNNDVTLGYGAVERALRRLDADDGVGAVGGKVVRAHGLLQEAGCIVWNDASTVGYGRDQDADAAEFNFVRDVDFCSGAFLMVRRSAWLQLGGMDAGYAPAYYEDTDLCLRLWRSGLRVVYDPLVVIGHIEYGSARNPLAPVAQMKRNRARFARQHMATLQRRYSAGPANLLPSRDLTKFAGRVLFVDDTVPMPGHGSGFGRSADIIACLLRLGHFVSVFPMNGVHGELPELHRHYPEHVELLVDRDIDQFDRLLAERAGYYDFVWFSRTHNLTRVAERFPDAVRLLGRSGVILDTEALAATRLAPGGVRPPSLHEELRHAYLAQKVIAVNGQERQQLLDIGLPNVGIIGHALRPDLRGAGFAARSGLLFVGSFHSRDTPNFDSVDWLVGAVLPAVRRRLGEAVVLHVAGYVAPGLDLGPLKQPGVVLHDFVADLRPLYAACRLFIAPTRYAAGIPYKVHEAASRGLPVVATALLAEQLGWPDGEALAVAATGDAAAWIEAVCATYGDAAAWSRLRDGAAARVAAECGQDGFVAAIEGALRDAAR